MRKHIPHTNSVNHVCPPTNDTLSIMFRFTTIRNYYKALDPEKFDVGKTG